MRDAAAPSDHISLQLPAARPLPSEVQATPASAVASIRAAPLGLVVTRRGHRSVQLRAPGLCTVQLAGHTAKQPIEMPAWFNFPENTTQLGFDAAVELQVHEGCREARSSALSWRQIEGPPLSELQISERGRHVHARTLPFSALYRAPLQWGIVPFSAHTQGRYVLEATFRQPWSSRLLRHRVTLTSIARSTGLPSLALGQSVVLGGTGWRRTQHAPAPNGPSELQTRGELTYFKSDAPGRYRLQDAEGHVLDLRVGSHDKTPLDCGRQECHAALTQTLHSSPMSHAFARLLTERPDPEAVACALECHTVGEPGLHDGGFVDITRALALRPKSPWRFEELPRDLRRLAGVRCSSCHGPGAIPDPAARELTLRSDVCATCHDAPPQYPHVAQWRSSGMARADASAQPRDDPRCTRCHTTGGFLQSTFAREARAPSPASGPSRPMGITCAACHAVHAADRGAKLVRTPAQPNAWAGLTSEPHTQSAICLPCHAPQPAEPLAAASSAVLWTGVARLPSATTPGSWDELRGPAPHLQVAKGCIGCHGAGQANNARTDHSFQVRSSSCLPCHALDPDPARKLGELRARARALQQRLSEVCGLEAPNETDRHAQTLAPAPRCEPPDLQRAHYALQLVLSDPGAEVHNAGFARDLLDEAARLLERAQHGT